MAPPALVIFDCDGVLVDSERLIIELDRSMLDLAGWTLSREEIVERFVGRSHEHLVDAFEACTGVALDEAWEAEYRHRERELFRNRLRPVEGIVEALDRIESRTCVASNGSHAKMRFTLGLTDLYTRFDGRIFSADQVVQGKPAPDLFIYAARRMGATPDACVVVEDSCPGVLAARAAGMTALGYAGSVTSAENLRDVGATVFHSMTDLPSLLEAM